MEMTVWLRIKLGEGNVVASRIPRTRVCREERIVNSTIYVNTTLIYVTHTMRGKQTNRRTTTRQIEHTTANFMYFVDRSKAAPSRATISLIVEPEE